MSPRKKGAPQGVARDAAARVLAGSSEAKRAAAAVLEVLSGLRSPPDASAALGCSLQRYYVLETRALQGLILALEPRPSGKRRKPTDEADVLRRDRDRLGRELARAQALVRAAQRAVGLAPTAPERAAGAAGRDGKKARRRRRPVARAGAVVLALRKEQEEATTASAAAASVAAAPCAP